MKFNQRIIKAVITIAKNKGQNRGAVNKITLLKLFSLSKDDSLKSRSVSNEINPYRPKT
jgi:hypothetical protein